MTILLPCPKSIYGDLKAASWHDLLEDQEVCPLRLILLQLQAANHELEDAQRPVRLLDLVGWVHVATLRPPVLPLAHRVPQLPQRWLASLYDDARV